MPENNKEYRIGIAGCGTISRIHAEAIAELEGAVLVAAFSRNTDKRERFCEEFGTKGYSDYNTFLGHQGLDVVVVCTPTGKHLDYGIPAADAGKHLIIEKPLEVTTEKGKRLLQRCKENNVFLSVVYQNRYIPSVRKMKEYLDRGAIGDVVMVRASVKWYRDQAYYDTAPWRGTFALDGGGALINQGIHTVDLLQWIAGPVKKVNAFKATLTHSGIEGEDNLVSILSFEKGALGVLEASTSILPAQSRLLEINGTKGTLRLDGDELTLSVNNDEPPSKEKSAKKNKTAMGASSPLAGFIENHHLTQYKEIFHCLRNGKQPPVSGSESLRSLALAEAAYRSSEEGRAVLPEIFL